jgi:hypothetical protein
MLLADNGFDLFDFWRQILVIASTIYVLVTTGQWLYSWYVMLRAKDRYTVMARQYLLIQLLRLSPKRFFWELLDLFIWTVVLIALIFLHMPWE